MKEWKKDNEAIAKIESITEKANFLNEIESIAEKYGWNIGGYNFETEDWLDIFFVPAIGMDSLNRKF